MKLIYIKNFESFNNATIWYRGGTPKQQIKNVAWFTSNKKMAEKYLQINSILNGESGILEELKIDISKLNILDLNMYDMDSKMDEHEIEEVLKDIGIQKCIEFDYIKLFDPIEDKIPLSRLINSMMDVIIEVYDVILIKESRKNTLAIKTSLIR